jgi:hypothetical protein
MYAHFQLKCRVIFSDSVVALQLMGVEQRGDRVFRIACDVFLIAVESQPAKL